MTSSNLGKGGPGMEVRRECPDYTDRRHLFFIVKHLPDIYLLDNIRVVKFLK